MPSATSRKTAMNTTMTRKAWPRSEEVCGELAWRIFTLIHNHPSLGICGHGWSTDELAEPWNIRVGYLYPDQAGWNVTTIGSRHVHFDRADIMQRGGRESLDARRSARWIAAAMHNRIAHTFIGGIRHHRIGVHQPAQLEYPEDDGKNDHDHHGRFEQTLAALAA